MVCLAMGYTVCTGARWGGGMSQVILGWRYPKGSGLGGRQACVIAPHPTQGARASTPGQRVKSLSLWAQPLMKGTPKCPFRHDGPPLKETGLNGCHWAHENPLCLVLMLRGPCSTPGANLRGRSAPVPQIPAVRWDCWASHCASCRLRAAHVPCGALWGRLHL